MLPRGVEKPVHSLRNSRQALLGLQLSSIKVHQKCLR